jgi:AcrR family transcriptional regulator
VPKLWDETIEAHRNMVREAILETTWQLVTERGLLSVTMSQIAEQVGIGRATLYKYFPDIEAILIAYHDQHVDAHLEHLAAVRDRPGDPARRLETLLEQYGLICYRRARSGAPEIGALLHRPEHVAHAERRLTELFRGLLTEVAAAGGLREDVSADELSVYCLHALTAAGDLPSQAAVRRLVTVTLAGLRP